MRFVFDRAIRSVSYRKGRLEKSGSKAGKGGCVALVPKVSEALWERVFSRNSVSPPGGISQDWHRSRRRALAQEIGWRHRWHWRTGKISHIPRDDEVAPGLFGNHGNCGIFEITQWRLPHPLW